MLQRLTCLALVLWAFSSPAKAEVRSLAGTGTAGAEGEGGPAADAQVGGPFGVVVGPDGAVYVCEITHHRVRRIDRASGKIETVAGSGQQGYAGDGGPAVKAQLNEPYEVRFDAAGNMFFVEMQNHVVRRVDARSKKITTVAGSGQKGFSGDGGPAVKAQLNRPHSIALDRSGNLYICDIGNHRIRRVDLKTGIISTFSGTGEKKPTPDGARLKGTPLNGPRALDYDPAENKLYLALREGNAVYAIDLESKTLHHLAGTGKKGYTGDGGPAREATLSGPKGIAVAPNGDIYLADTESHTIRAIRRQTGIIETVIGDGKQGDGPDGPARQCRLARPHGIFVDRLGAVYVGDSSNHRVRVLAAPAAETSELKWKRMQLDARFRSEGVAAADVNHDGKTDVLAGDVWYEAPDWKIHEIRPPGDFVAGVGYSNSFCNFAADVNQDGWDDLILIGFPGDPFHWYENPKNQPGHWKAHEIWHSACNESPEFEDLDGDGKLEIVLGSQPERQMGFLRLPPANKATEKWKFQAVGEPGDPHQNGTFKYYHGIGVTDVNGDGRRDLLIPHGWWEAPEKPTNSPWRFHPLLLAPPGATAALKAANMYCQDFDLDGDQDIVMSSAHAFGVWWFENVGNNSQPDFRYHLIDDSYSQTHALEFVDMNGDGQKDLVTGKRFYAHNGNDPGGRAPVVMYWYEIRRRKGRPPEFIPHEIEAGRDTGVGTQFLVHDMNQDGRPDIVLSNKKGVNVLLQD